MATPEEIANAKALEKAKERLAEVQERLNEAYEDENDRLGDLLTQEREKLRIMKLKGDATEDELRQQREKIQNQIKLNALDREQNETASSLAGSLAGMLGVKKDFNKTMTGSIVATMGSAEAQKKLGKELKETFNIQAVGLSILTKFVEATMALALETDKSLVAFNKQTGAARKYGTEIRALERDMFMHGVGVEEAAEAYGSLVTNVTDLRLMSSSTRKELSTTTSLLAHMGVNADTTAANVQLMTKSMGVSVTQASSFQRELFTLAQEIGMPPEEMAAGFKAAAPKLMAFGKQAGKVFKTLAVNARAAGMEVEQMLGIVEQFDTFEGAAESVGKLNALLGGPFLNSMEMVTTTDPTERMRMLSGALNDAGKSFDQMTYYEKKSIAAAAGLSDVNELALVMAGSFDKSAGGAGKSQAEIQKLAEQSKEFNTIAEEFIQMMKMFAIEMYPVVEGLKSIMQWLQWLMPLFKALTPAILGIASAMVVFQAGLKLTELATLGFTGAWNLSPFAIITVFGIAIYAVGQMLNNVFGPAIAGITVAIITLTAAFIAFNVATAGIPIAIGIIVTGLVTLMTILFGTDVGHSNFLEGLWKFGWAFDDIGTSVGGLVSALVDLIPVLFKFLTPFGLIMTAWEAIAGSSKETEQNMSRMSTKKPLARATDAVNRDSLGDATQAAKPVTYKSDTPQGISQKSGGSSAADKQAKPPAQDHKVKLEFDPRSSGFKEFIIEIVDNKLNENTGSPR